MSTDKTMKIQCPACAARGRIDGTSLPGEGKRLICPRCGERFTVRPERSAAEIIQQRERMLCPNCGCEQPLAETCVICGVVIKEFIREQELRRQRERLELTTLRLEVRDTDSWYQGLFDYRTATLIIRVIALFIFLAMLMTCSLRGHRRTIEAWHGKTFGKTSWGIPGPAFHDSGKPGPQVACEPYGFSRVPAHVVLLHTPAFSLAPPFMPTNSGFYFDNHKNILTDYS